MKRLLIIVAALAVWQLSPAQIGARWWFDDGGGDTQVMGIAIENQLQIDVSTLSRGYHTLYIQPLDTSNLEQINPTTLSTSWMPPRKYTVYINNPNAEPPVAWTDQTYASRQTLGDGASLVGVSSAAIGFHTLYVHWGGMLLQRLYYRSAMQDEEQAYYWLDNARQPSLLDSAAVDVASLTAGFHTVHIAIGRQVRTALFYKTDPLTQYTLWIDEDFDARLSGTTSGTIVADVSELSDTVHTAYIAIDNRIESYDFLKVPVAYTVQVFTADSLKGTVAGRGVFPKGSIAPISANAEYGYQFGQWSDGDTNAIRDLVVMSDTTLTAYFVPDTFDVEVTVSDTAMGTIVLEGTSEYLGTDTATAIPNYGYHFEGWSDGDTTNPRLVTLTQDTALTALFAPNIYSVTLMSEMPEWGSALGDGEYPYLTIVPIEAVAALGYQFKQWDDGNTDNPRQLVVRGDTALTALFELQRYTLTVNSNDLSRGFTQGAGTFSVLDTATALAITLAGHSFLGWSDGSMDNPRQMQIWCDTTVTALFKELESFPETVVVHDTMTLHDTAYVDVYVHDTTVTEYIHDTTTVPEYIHDTAYITLTDTVTNTVYDTVTNTVYDTINNFIHDTTTVTEYIHDTAYVDVPYPVHDTTTVTEYIHDTAYIDVPYPVHDTAYITLTDTVTNTVYDTVTNTVFDTVTNFIHDTTLVTVTDTVLLTEYDTIYITLYDTVYIHDTVYVPQEGVEEITTTTAKIYQRNGMIVVEGSEGYDVGVFDAVGRMVNGKRREENGKIVFDVRTSGVYLVKVGDAPARRVVVIR